MTQRSRSAQARNRPSLRSAALHTRLQPAASRSHLKSRRDCEYLAASAEPLAGVFQGSRVKVTTAKMHALHSSHSPLILLVPRVAPRSHLAWRFALTRPAAGGCCGMATSLPQDGSTVKLKGLPFKATVEVSQRARPRHAARHCRERPACCTQAVDRVGSRAPSASVHPQDILEFLHDFTLTGDSVFLTRHPDGRPNGEVRTQSTSSLKAPEAWAGAQLAPIGHGVNHAPCFAVFARRHSSCSSAQLKRAGQPPRTGMSSAQSLETDM